MFKAGTDDLRESHKFGLVELVHSKCYSLRSCGRNVHYSALTGSNLCYVRAHLPHLADLLTDDIHEVWDHADLLVVGNKDPEYRSVLDNAQDSKITVDLVRMDRKTRSKDRKSTRLNSSH